MKKLSLLLAVMASFLLAGCDFGTIETGNVGVRTQFGKIQQDEENPGFYFTVMSSVDEYTAKETSVVLSNMTPKAKDKLILKDLDVAVYYKAKGPQIAEFVSSHASMSARMEKERFIRPGYFLVENTAKGVVMDKVSEFDSLTLHQSRSDLEMSVKKALQDELDKSDQGFFEITRVVVTSLLTDPSVEDSIRKNIQMNNEIDTAMKEVRKKKEEADAMMKTAAALTPLLVQHEYVKAIEKCAGNNGCTLIVGGGGSVPLINLPK